MLTLSASFWRLLVFIISVWFCWFCKVCIWERWRQQRSSATSGIATSSELSTRESPAQRGQSGISTNLPVESARMFLEPAAWRNHLENTIPAGVILKLSNTEILGDFGDNHNELPSLEDCSICLVAYENGQSIRKSENCSHIFHSSCILDWLKQRTDCPCCRQSFVDVELGIAPVVLDDAATLEAMASGPSA